MAPQAARPTPTSPARSGRGAFIDHIGECLGETLPLVKAGRDDAQRFGSHAVRRAQDANADAVPPENLSHVMCPFAERVLEMNIFVGVQVETGHAGQSV